MGTIRNEIVIVQDWHKNRIEALRQSAVTAFQEIADESRDDWDRPKFDVDKQMVSPILESFINGEYTFFINGECSKLGWKDSIDFRKVRDKWVEEHKHDASYIIIMNFGEDGPPEVRWTNAYMWGEDEE